MRRIRVQLKPGWAEVPDANRLALREKVKALELQAEFIQLSVIETWLQAHSSDAGLALEQALPELLKAGVPKDGALAKAFDVVAQAARALA